MGHVAPASSHVEPVPPLGASQHSCPAAQWTAPVAVNGQYVPGVVSGWSTGAVPQLGPESTGAAASSPGVVGLHSAAAVADAAAQSVHDTHAILSPPREDDARRARPSGARLDAGPVGLPVRARPDQLTLRCGRPGRRPRVARSRQGARRRGSSSRVERRSAAAVEPSAVSRCLVALEVVLAGRASVRDAAHRLLERLARATGRPPDARAAAAERGARIRAPCVRGPRRAGRAREDECAEGGGEKRDGEKAMIGIHVRFARPSTSDVPRFGSGPRSYVGREKSLPASIRFGDRTDVLNAP